LVGIGGGIPSEDEDDTQLRDVVVSKPTAKLLEVVQFDKGKFFSNRKFEQTRALAKPLAVLLANLHKLEAQHIRISNQISKYLLEM
jgi:hypothetical protein